MKSEHSEIVLTTGRAMVVDEVAKGGRSQRGGGLLFVEGKGGEKELTCSINTKIYGVL